MTNIVLTGWTEWSCNNQEGSGSRFQIAPQSIAGLQVREQGGYGLVNVRFGYRDVHGNKRWLPWLTNNSEGEVRSEVWLAPDAKSRGVTAREQGNYGIVNLRLDSTMPTADSWACANGKGAERKLALGADVFAVQVREQGSFGVVDVRVGKGLPEEGNWMDRNWDTIKDSPLWLLPLPGTHDSGTSRMRNVGGAKTQTASIYEQLCYGFRYFDLRFTTNMDKEGTRTSCTKYPVYHGCALSRDTLDTVLTDVTDFLAATKREIFVLHIRSDVDDRPKEPMYLGHQWKRTTLNEDKAVIAEMISRLGRENIVGRQAVKAAGRSNPAECRPAELLSATSKSRVIIVWWGIHDAELAKDAFIDDHVWLSGLLQPDGKVAYGPDSSFENAYLQGMDLSEWRVQSLDIQAKSSGRYWLRSGDKGALIDQLKAGDTSVAKLPWNIAWGNFFGEQEYLAFGHMFVGRTIGKCTLSQIEAADAALKKTAWTVWTCNNDDGTPRPGCFTAGPVCGVQVREQGGYGVVNVRLGYRGGGGEQRWGEWLTNNFEGQARSEVWLASGLAASGLTVREQSKFGIVNVRLDVSSNQHSDWACGNMEGSEKHVVLSASQSFTRVQAKEQGNYGVVDMRIGSA